MKEKKYDNKKIKYKCILYNTPYCNLCFNIFPGKCERHIFKLKENKP